MSGGPSRRRFLKGVTAVLALGIEIECMTKGVLDWQLPSGRGGSRRNCRQNGQRQGFENCALGWTGGVLAFLVQVVRTPFRRSQSGYEYPTATPSILSVRSSSDRFP